MNYIVLDLEWNQPASFQSAAYRRIGDKLLFEVLQFGAAKLDEHLHIIDTISILVHPTYYPSIHSRIKRITGLSKEVLSDAEAFPEAMGQFVDWCGDDYVFVTWGADDISVLKQNLDCFELDYPLPHTYNLQKLYALSIGKSGQTALKTAMEEIGINEEEERSFHNAEHDAYYTALILQKLQEPQKLMNFEARPKKLVHNENHTRIHITHQVSSVEEALHGDLLNKPSCPLCNKSMSLQTQLIPQSAGRYVSLAKCQTHGIMFIRAHFIRLRDQSVGLSLNISPATEQYRAYVHTKELQYQYKRKRGDYSNFDPENLTADSGFTMPFDD